MADSNPTPDPVRESQIRAARFVETLFRSADLGPVVRKKAKEMFPDIALPEDTIDPVVAPLRQENETLRKRFEELSAKFEEREKKDSETSEFQKLEAAVTQAVNKFGLTDEGRAAMLDRMKETKNFTDVEAAAAWVAHSKPVEPTAGPSWTIGATKMNLFGSAEPDEQFKQLHMNPEMFLENQLREFASNPDKYVAETFGRAA